MFYFKGFGGCLLPRSSNFSVTAPNCQYRISARQATKTRTGKILPCFFHVFSCPFPGAGDPSGEAAQPQLFTPLPAHIRSPHILCSTSFCLSQCSQHQYPSRLGQEPPALQLWVSWPALLGISSPPILTSQLKIFDFLADFPPFLLRLLLGEVFLP